MTAVSLYIYYLTHKELKRNEIEMRSGRHALLPMLLAERDREYLKQIRINRDEEEKLMANVEGWKVMRSIETFDSRICTYCIFFQVGTWYGEPIYKTKPADTWVDPTFKEFYGNTTYKAFASRAHLKLWS